jgi:exonuclease SbcD
VGLLDAQVRFVDFLVDLVRAEGVEAVLVSGDIYDRALPSPDTVDVLADAVTRLVDAGAQVVLTSGNHDSAIRLGFASELLARAGVHIGRRWPASAPRWSSAARRGLSAALSRADGGRSIARGPSERSHAAVVRAAMDRSPQPMLQAIRLPSIVMAHAFVAGGTTSESEREVAVGGVSVVPADVFDGMTYAALGHLHRPQWVRDDVAYSGSPLAMSFGEADQVKSVALLEVTSRPACPLKRSRPRCPGGWPSCAATSPTC